MLAGIGAGYLVDRELGGSQEANDLRALGNELGMIGSWAFLVAVVLTGVVLVRRDGRAALPGAVILFAGAANFVHWPSGGLAMLGVAGGCGWPAYGAGSRPGSQRGGPAPVRS